MKIWYLIAALVTLFAMMFARTVRERCECYYDVAYKKLRFKDKSVAEQCAMFLAFSILVCMAAFRDNIGADYSEYAKIFQDFVNNGFNSRLEIGFCVLSWLVSLVSDSNQVFFAVCGLVIYLPIFLFCSRNSKCPELSIFLFIAFGLLSSSFNGIRQWMAASIIFLGFKHVVDKQFLKYLIVVLIAFCFHQTAIIMIPFYFIVRMKGNDKFRFFIIFATIITAIFFRQIVGIIYKIVYSILGDHKYTGYLNPDTIINENGKWLSFPLFCLITYGMYLYLKYRGIKMDRAMEVGINFIVLGFACSGLGQLNWIFTRLQFFFVLPLLVVIPNLLTKFRNKDIMYLLVVLAGSAYILLTAAEFRFL